MSADRSTSALWIPFCRLIVTAAPAPDGRTAASWEPAAAVWALFTHQRLTELSRRAEGSVVDVMREEGTRMLVPSSSPRTKPPPSASASG